VIDYRIKIRRQDGLLIEHSDCNGQDSTIITDRKCAVTMVSLLESTYGLVEGDQIQVTVESRNSIDYSYPSLLSGDALV